MYTSYIIGVIMKKGCNFSVKLNPRHAGKKSIEEQNAILIKRFLKKWKQSGILKELKEKRKIKKALTDTLVTTMKGNDIDCFDLSGGNKLIYTQSKGKKALSKKHLLASLSDFFKGDAQEAAALSEYILSTREDNIKENIRRKAAK